MNIKKFFASLSKYDWLAIACFFVTFPLMELLNRPIGTVRNFHIPFDDHIPVIENLIFVYHLWSPTIVLLGFLFLYRQRELGRSYFFTLGLAQIQANLTFILCQTYVPRLPVEELSDSLAGRIIAHTYQIDNHYCGFPSIHVSLCTILIIYIWQAPVSRLTQILVTAWMLLISASTVLVKQHVFLDIPGGVVNGLLAYAIVYLVRRHLSKNKKARA